ncbi:ClpP/crotonase-like domain-containing protein [Mycotypha africana]|uniref:ClpP/crotonase-like domain-containing protein n=1 Tax=Mycotypha africana TaxID=64632 RepID=UPI0023000E2E|nr:ClpP/crotonase-like domain-containing protein [Mycotypha africana]KAI8979796.1 ClpP/crotonase-like domain-containing protein [Mycotypha africana]
MSLFTIRHSTRCLPTINVGRLTVRSIVTTQQQHSSNKEAYLEHLQNGITLLKLNRPASRNALSVNLVSEFRQALADIRFSGDSRVLIIQSATPGAFCSGADLKERAGMSPIQVTQFLYNLRKAYRELETLPIPTIAAIDGPAFGGGLEMALCCDIRVAGPSAKMGLTETKLAIIPGAGGTQRLPRLIGIPRAKELVYTGEILDPKKAKEYGVVGHLDESSALNKAMQIAESILPNGPVAIRMAKLAIDRGSHLDMDSGLEIEQSYYAQIIPTEDRLEGLRAFKEKRKPVYKGC